MLALYKKGKGNRLVLWDAGKDFAFAEGHQVATVATPACAQYFVRYREAPRLQAAQVNGEEDGTIVAVVAERGQHGRRIGAKDEAAEVHADVAADRDASPRHAGADQLDARAIPLDHHLTVVGVSLDVEEVAERNLRVAVLHGERRDLGERLAGEGLRRDALGLDRNG